jgi:alpha-galactosidase
MLIALLAGVALQNTSAEDNGLERTPVLGWSSWSFLRQHPTAAQMKAQALALHNSGLQKTGYEYVNLDDFWYQCPGPHGPNVDPNGRWVTDSSRFPAEGDTDGIKVVADYIHSLGMKFGIYVTPGISKQAVSRNTPIKGTSYTAAEIAEPSVKENNYNCKGMVRIDYNKPGAQEYTNSWADMLAAWNIDYIKIDGMTDSNADDVKAVECYTAKRAVHGPGRHAGAPYNRYRPDIDEVCESMGIPARRRMLSLRKGREATR